MHIQDIFAKGRPTFSFEFMPPHSDNDAELLYKSVEELRTLQPDFVSVTYGAGGSTRQRTNDLVVRLKEQSGCDPVPHLTCVCHSQQEIDTILQRYAEHGISNIMALGGDIPRTRPDHDRSTDAFRYAADLVRHIRQFGEQMLHPDPRGFGIGVAGFPEGHPFTPNRLLEMDYLKAKVDAGADYIVTQLFFDNRDFYDFRERCDLAGIKIPILAGILPILSESSMQRTASLTLGVRIPAGLLRAVRRCNGEDEYVRRVGQQWATEQCRDLLDNHVDGIHFYTFNRSQATRRIYANLGVKDSSGLAV